MKYLFCPDRATVIITVMCVIVLIPTIGYVINAINAGKWMRAIPTIILHILFLFFLLRAPFRVYVYNEEIVVKPILGSTKITNITRIEPVEKDDIKGAVRLFGNGGFCGYVGTFSSEKLGKFYMAAINTKEIAKITTACGKIYIGTIKYFV